MNEHKEKIINLFYDNAKNIPGIFDIILRGSGNNKNKIKSFVKDWSDLDFSLIVEEINLEIMGEVRRIYNLLKQFTDMKITIILVSQIDFFTKHHCHGISPMAYPYSSAFNNSISLLKNDINYAGKNFQLSNIYKLSCYSYLSYLIHDLRNRYIMCASNIIELREFLKHLVKRTSNILWNATFLKTGYLGEDICEEKLFNSYPMLDSSIFVKLNDARSNWEATREDVPKIYELIEYLFTNVEYIYQNINKYFEQEVAV